MTATDGTGTEDPLAETTVSRNGSTPDDVVLDVANLTVGFPSDDGLVEAVRGVTYQLRSGEVLGIVGESGSGKSVTSLAVMGLLPGNARVSGSVKFRGKELIGASEAEYNSVRGRNVAMIFQDPMTSLNPVYSVGYQVAEAVRAHHTIGKAAALDRAADLLELVRIPNPRQRLDNYPHELSGGMRQRVVIAIAMANNPDVIIADEPTTALDVTVQAQIMESLQLAQQETGAAMVLITHDLGVIAGQADRVMVMYAGKPVETGTVEDIYYTPRMPYTFGLLGSLPRLDRVSERLTPIPGAPPSVVNMPPGCPFTSRCPLSVAVCEEREPDLEQTTGPGHLASCHRSDLLVGRTPGDVFETVVADTEALANFVEITEEPISAQALRKDAAERPAPILTANNLVKNFPIRSKGLIRRQIGAVQAVSDVSFELGHGETLGLVGESGCGKSTTARLVLNLIPATSGEVLYDGKDLTTLSAKEMRTLRQDLQIVFQDPYASLDPRMPVNEIIAEPLRIHGRYDDGGREQVQNLLRTVGLKPEHGNRYPHEFSGGQRQRIGVARALALRPKVLVLDEPVSALDVSIQAGVLNLLDELQTELNLSYLFVSHDLSVVRHIADRIAVMYLGKLVETGTADELFDGSAHPYTQALISAIPIPDPRKERARDRVVVVGDVPSPADPPSGCRFRTRCPKFAAELGDAERTRCTTEEPALTVRDIGHPVACHFAQCKQMVCRTSPPAGCANA